MSESQSADRAGTLIGAAPGESTAVMPAAPSERRLRLWPAIVILVVQWLVVKGVGWVAPETMLHFMTRIWAPFIGALLFLGWWLFASRIRWQYRITVVVAFAALAAMATLLRHPSFNGIGLVAFYLYALQALTAVCAAWLLITPWLRWPVRQVGLIVLFALVWGYFALLRFEGTDGSMSADLPYRWVPTAEENLAAFRAKAAKTVGQADSVASALVLQPGDWPGFRGPNRDGRLTGVRIAADWDKNPPRQKWRHPVGPGWSSFAVVGSRLYTQEQRDAEEAVVCYDCGSGLELWAHQDTTRFTEAIAGPGPRATPTFHEGKIFALGASGRLNCLDAVTGNVIWSRDIVTDSGRKSGKAEDEVPTWGFASSPLVVRGIVSVFAGGPDKKSVLGYDAASGKLVWAAGEGKFSYGSLHPARLGGVEQIILASEIGLTAFDPAKGDVLWEHAWPLTKGMARIVQPAVVDDRSVLLGTGFSMGTRRVDVERQGDKWALKEAWTTQAIKPYYNDLVVHKGHIYGFDGSLFVCVKLEDGKKTWRERGFGNGQVLLLADQDLLLILSETGEAALVRADPAAYKELGRFQAIEGKTWNHPVVAHGMLFVRNGAEAACYQFSEATAGAR